jgi:hypothetical protein
LRIIHQCWTSLLCSWLQEQRRMPVRQSLPQQAVREPLLRQEPVCNQRWVLCFGPQGAVQMSTRARRKRLCQVHYCWLQVWPRVPTWQSLLLWPVPRPLHLLKPVCTERSLPGSVASSNVQVSTRAARWPESILQSTSTRSSARMHQGLRLRERSCMHQWTVPESLQSAQPVSPNSQLQGDWLITNQDHALWMSSGHSWRWLY